jgi:hypothetical protein
MFGMEVGRIWKSSSTKNRPKIRIFWSRWMNQCIYIGVFPTS